MVPPLLKMDRRGLAHVVLLILERNLVQLMHIQEIRHIAARLLSGLAPFRRRHLAPVDLHGRVEPVPLPDARRGRGIGAAMVARVVREADPRAAVHRLRRLDPCFEDRRSRAVRGEVAAFDAELAALHAREGVLPQEHRRLRDILREQRAVRERHAPAHVGLAEELERVRRIVPHAVALRRRAALDLDNLREARIANRRKPPTVVTRLLVVASAPVGVAEENERRHDRLVADRTDARACEIVVPRTGDRAEALTFGFIPRTDPAVGRHGGDLERIK